MGAYEAAVFSDASILVFYHFKIQKDLPLYYIFLVFWDPVRNAADPDFLLCLYDYSRQG